MISNDDLNVEGAHPHNKEYDAGQSLTEVTSSKATLMDSQDSVVLFQHPCRVDALRVAGQQVRDGGVEPVLKLALAGLLARAL